MITKPILPKNSIIKNNTVNKNGYIPTNESGLWLNNLPAITLPKIFAKPKIMETTEKSLKNTINYSKNMLVQERWKVGIGKERKVVWTSNCY